MLACFVKKEYLKTGHHRHRFCLFLVFFKQTLQFLQQINVKNLHQVSGVGIQTYDP